MLGLPFLSPREQFLDALTTLKWVYSHQCRPVLFPINIKPYTLLMEMYKTGQYNPISHWLIFLLLEQLTEKELSQIIIVWHGNRMENYADPALQQIPPVACEKCLPIIESFYADFAAADSGNECHHILNDVLHKPSCDCLHKARVALCKESGMEFMDRYMKCIYFFEMTEKGKILS